MVQKFIRDSCFVCCDDIFPCQKLPTYVNIALNQQSFMDYVLISAANDIKSFAIVDPNINFSDHLPLAFKIVISMYSNNISDFVRSNVSSNRKQCQLRLDKANKESYYYYYYSATPYHPTPGNGLTPALRVQDFPSGHTVNT